MSETIDDHVATSTTVPAAPYSRLVQRAAGVCLLVAALTNGLSQYLGELVAPDGDFSDQIRWGAEHVALHRTEQTLMVVSALFMPLGLLAVAQVTRWTAPRLTLVAVPLMLWGMWGFHNVIAMGYVSGTVTPSVLSVEDAVTLNDGLVSDPGVVITALVPHLLGSFFGLLLLSIAAWRSRAFSPAASVLVIAFLVWDFLFAPVGPLEAHLLLTVAWVWWGITLLRMPHEQWRTGANPAPSR
jgi:hypothetical protein